MSEPKPKHQWEFRPRFRRHAFGWRSGPAIERVRQAVSEIKRVARKDPVLGAEGAVLFLERVSPALEYVDGSSGAIGTAVVRAIDELVPILASAPVDAATRDRWLERLWNAYQADDMPYIEALGDAWGTLCASPEVASVWADKLIGITRMALSPDPELHGFFKGTTACLSALVAAGRHEEVLQLLALERTPFWPYRRYGVKALVGLGRRAEALRYAEASLDSYTESQDIAATCESILLSSGLAEEAYRRYGLAANQRTTRIAWFRAVAAKYRTKEPREILADLVAFTPGEEGKWFAAAKDAGLLDEAVALANASPCDPRTLARAARDFGASEPAFAMEAGVAALRWLVEGYGYEVTGEDVRSAYDWTVAAARYAGAEQGCRRRVMALVQDRPSSSGWAHAILVLAIADEERAARPRT